LGCFVKYFEKCPPFLFPSNRLKNKYVTYILDNFLFRFLRKIRYNFAQFSQLFFDVFLSVISC